MLAKANDVVDLRSMEALVLAFAVPLPLLLLNVAAAVRNRLRPGQGQPYSTLRPGILPPAFYAVLALQAANILVVPPLFCVLGQKCPANSPASLSAALLQSAFWAVCLFRFWRNRHRHEQPVSLCTSYALSALASSALPLLRWHTEFPRGVRGAEFPLYCVQSSIVLCIFVAVLSKATLKRDGPSRWNNFCVKLEQIWPYLWPQGRPRLQLAVAASFALMAAERVVNILMPLYAKWIVDALTGPQPRFCYNLILVEGALNFFHGYGGITSVLQQLAWFPVRQHTALKLEVDLLRHLHNLSLRWHLSRKTGEVLRIMEKGTSSMSTLQNFVLMDVLPSLLDILLAAAFFFSNFNIYFGFLMLLTMALYLGVTIAISEWRASHQKAANEAEQAASAISVDSLINYETIKHHSAEQIEAMRYKSAYKRYLRADMRTELSYSLLEVSQNSVISASLTAGSLLAAYMIAQTNSGFSAGDYVLFTTYLMQLYTPLALFGTVYRTLQKTFINMENMLQLFNEDMEIAEMPGALKLAKMPGRIEFVDVSFAYKPQKPVLQNLSFCVEPGETFALVGPSGSGKSTLIRLLFRLYDVSAGEILFNGTNIRQLQLESLRQRIAIVPQDTVLFNDTIRYNIRYGRPDASDAEVEEAARAAAIHEFIVSHPDGYECMVGERGLKLSGGEKQRVAIARALLKGPEYILLDEATSALDSKTERAIQRNLEELCQRRTCLIVAHRLSTITHANKILVLSAGRVVEMGSHEQLLEQNGLYAEMYRLQNERPPKVNDDDGAADGNEEEESSSLSEEDSLGEEDF